MRSLASGEDRDYFPDYRSRPAPTSFREVVKAAYKSQYKQYSNKAIAGLVGVDPSTISLILKYPHHKEAHSIEGILKPLSNLRHQKMIIEAWVRARWPEAMESKLAEDLAKPPVTNETCLRIEAMMRREGAQFHAMNAALLAFQRTDNEDLKDKLLDLLHFCHLRLGNFGRALSYVREIAHRARERGNPLREARAHLSRAMILIRMETASYGDLVEILNRVKALGKAVTSTELDPSASRFIAKDLRLLEAEVEIYGMERSKEANYGLIERCEREIAKVLSESNSGYVQLQCHFLLGRLHLLRGETFLARERSEEALRLQSEKNLAYGLTLCSIFHSRILEEDSGSKAAEAYLYEAICGAESLGDFHSQRQLEHRLAHLENSMFQ